MDHRLSRFLAASLVLHGVALAAIIGRNAALPGQTPINQFLPVSLERPVRSAGQQIGRSQPAATSVSATRGQVDGLVHAGAGPASGQDNGGHGAQSTVASDPEPSANTASSNRIAQPKTMATGQRLQQALHAALLPYFQYPLMARRQGWQGEVQVALHIARDGRLSGLRVAHTSGYPVLDAAALESLRNIQQLPDTVVSVLDDSGFDLQLPVVYRLTEG